MFVELLLQFAHLSLQLCVLPLDLNQLHLALTGLTLDHSMGRVDRRVCLVTLPFIIVDNNGPFVEPLVLHVGPPFRLAFLERILLVEVLFAALHVESFVGFLQFQLLRD